MTETKNITIALGVICVVLAAGLIAAVASGSSFSDQPNTSDLEKQISNLNTQVTSLQNKVKDYEEHIDTLVDENNYYASIIAIEESMVILNEETYTQDADTTTVLFDDALNYAGYIEIHVESTSDTTYIQVSYTYENLEFNQTIHVGTNGTAQFPVLPGTIEILLCNADTETNATTVTMTYFY